MATAQCLGEERTRLKIRDRDRHLLARREEVVSEGGRTRNPEQTRLLPEARICSPTNSAPRGAASQTKFPSEFRPGRVLHAAFAGPERRGSQFALDLRPSGDVARPTTEPDGVGPFVEQVRHHRPVTLVRLPAPVRPATF